MDLGGEVGLDLVNQDEVDSIDDSREQTASLLPALAPTPMGWKSREWFFGVDPVQLFDRAGNFGPTV